jgi:hypothetical protein
VSLEAGDCCEEVARPGVKAAWDIQYSHMTVLTSIVFFDSHGGPQKSSTRLLKQAVYVNSSRSINEMDEMPFHQLKIACQKRAIIRFDAF